MMSDIVTRFPPSPTGYLHVGGARTALFNWFYARHMKGKFILRIEDTDTVRSSKESVDAIFEALEWLEIDWDEGPFFQSERLSLYEEYIDRLIQSNHAYYCTCSQDSLKEMREKAMSSGGKPKYDGTCRNKSLSKTKNAVVRFKAPLDGTTVVHDAIRRDIEFQNTELDDFIIQRSDGMPTYNFVVVVDDITMGINTIIRGDDHINNTPRQLLLYKALESPVPMFGHVPMVLGKDRSRLSKRHGAMSVTAYRDMGYLPEALINYLMRLGWSYGDQEFFTIEEIIQKFTLENIGKSAGIFDPEKLLSLNADHIKALKSEDIVPHLLPFINKKEQVAVKGPFLEKVIDSLKTRSKTLKEMAEGAHFYYVKNILYEEKAAKKFLKQATLEPIQLLCKKLEALDGFTEPDLENAFKEVMNQTGLKLGKIAQPVRVALTGTTVSPGIFEIIDTLGKERTISRLKAAEQFILEKLE